MREEASWLIRSSSLVRSESVSPIRRPAASTSSLTPPTLSRMRASSAPRLVSIRLLESSKRPVRLLSDVSILPPNVSAARVIWSAVSLSLPAMSPALERRRSSKLPAPCSSAWLRACWRSSIAISNMPMLEAIDVEMFIDWSASAASTFSRPSSKARLMASIRLSRVWRIS